MFYAIDQMRPNPGHEEDLTFDQTGGRTSTERTNARKEEVNEQPTERVTVAEAAQLLGMSAEAVRMRVKRGSLKSAKIKGTVYVLMDAEQTRPNIDQTGGDSNMGSERTDEQTRDRTALVDVLRSDVEFLREELKRREEVHAEESRRKDTIIAQLTQRIPELEPPSEPQEAPVTPSEDAAKGTASPEQQEATERPRSSWWRQFFGLEWVEVSDALMEALFNLFLGVLILLLGIKARTYRSGSVSANNPRRRSSEAERSKGFWRRLFGGYDEWHEWR
jgi:hypothetical protein